jgi:hypothetical protein
MVKGGKQNCNGAGNGAKKTQQDQRSNQFNPNNVAHKASRVGVAAANGANKQPMTKEQQDQRSNQFNPNNVAHKASRVGIAAANGANKQPMTKEQQDQRSNQFNPNNVAHKASRVGIAAANGANKQRNPPMTKEQQDQRSKQFNPNNVAYKASRVGAAAHTGKWASVTSGQFQATSQIHKPVRVQQAEVAIVENIAHEVFGSSSHLRQVGSKKKGTNTSHSDLDYQLETPTNVTRKQRQQFVCQLQQQNTVTSAKAKTNAVALVFSSGLEVDIVPKDVAYTSKQKGFQQHKQQHNFPEFRNPALQHAATQARVLFQGPAKGYEVDKAVSDIASKCPRLVQDPTGKSIFNKLIASGPASIKLHEHPKAKSVEKRRRHLQQKFHEAKKL